eukprot:gene13414-biopygen15582
MKTTVVSLHFTVVVEVEYRSRRNVPLFYRVRHRNQEFCTFNTPLGPRRAAATEDAAARGRGCGGGSAGGADGLSLSAPLVSPV